MNSPYLQVSSCSLSIAKFNNLAKLEMPVKVRPQKRIAVATIKFPHPYLLQKAWTANLVHAHLDKYHLPLAMYP